MSEITPDTLIRYSPEPICRYGQSSVLIDTPERWNLAYLSFDFENHRFHKDPMFAVHVRRTTQIRLDGGGLDLVGQDPSACVGHLLKLMAPRFVYLMLKNGLLRTLPLYQAYGEGWVQTVELRARTRCVSDRELEDAAIGEGVKAAAVVFAGLIKRVRPSRK